MANTLTSLKLSQDTAFRFLEDFSSKDHSVIKYVFLGNSIPYANSDNTILDLMDYAYTEKTVWDNMYYAKRVTGNDVELVIPMIHWTGDTKYRQYDDQALLSDLISSNNSINLKPMYVMTSDYNIYMCLSNNNSSNSTYEPSGDYSTSNGFITTSDNYMWKYLYNVKQSNKFLTNEWIPAPSSIESQEYTTNESNLIDGSLSTIIVTNGGSGYYHSNIECLSFTTNISTISLNNLQNVAANMFVTGTGIISGTYITNVDVFANTISISLPTNANGGGTGNTLYLTTRVYINGDGKDDYLTTTAVANGEIKKITVTSVGSGYTRANVYIYGTGSNASARAVLSPKFGFGFNPARDLSSNCAMISLKIGHLDSTEGGLLSTNTDFRQYGLLSAPHKYANTSRITTNTANLSISQTTDLSLVAGTNYNINEIVYQGPTLQNSYFSGVVHSANTNVVRLINVKGTPVIGGILTGNTSFSSRAVVSYKNPEFEPYTGSILYVENVPKVTRTDGQAENIKIVIKF